MPHFWIAVWQASICGTSWFILWGKKHEDWSEPGSYCLKHVNSFKVLFIQILSVHGCKLFSSLFIFNPSKPWGRAEMTKRNWGRSKQAFLSSFSILIRLILCQTPLRSWAIPHTWCIHPGLWRNGKLHTQWHWRLPESLSRVWVPKPQTGEPGECSPLPQS